MVKGVKKIKFVHGAHYPKMTVAGKRVAIAPDEWAHFSVDQWLPDTTDAEKKKPVVWMRQSNDRKTIIYQVPSANGYKLQIPKKLCGAYYYYIEASLSGKRDTKNDVGIYVKGHCDPKIISSKWTTQRGSKHSIKNKKKTDYISYGHVVYLNLATEGLNGRKVIVELHNQQYAKKDKPIHVYTDVNVTDGEVNLKIKNTYAWMAYVDNIQNVEEFYVKVKDPVSKKYLVDNLGDDLHAIYLNVKNKVATTNSNVSQNQTPTKVYTPDVNAARIEPCKFEVIKITESEIKDGKANNTTVKVFDNGIGLKNTRGQSLQETIHRTIFFKFDGTIIDKDGESVLNNILKFLLEHKDSRINLSGFACVIGKENYNKGLSQRRADVVKKFFGDGGLDRNRIVSVGKGEVDPTDDKMGRDNVKFKNEKDYENNRRVDISFVFTAHDAQTIIYEVVAPSISTKKDLTIDVIGLETNSCFRATNKHKKEVYVVDVGQAIDSGDTKKTYTTPSFNYKVYSDLSRFNAFPIQYIWPSSTTPNQFHFHAHTCRYYSNEKRTTVLVNAYSDIKWTLTFFINLTNDLSVKWMNQPAPKIKELQSKAGKVGAERRWKQKDASFGFSLKSEWDSNKSGTYQRNKELKAEYESKFKKLYDLFASVGAMSDGITNKTKGQIRNVGFKGLPMIFAVKPPNLNLKAEWSLERAKKKNVEIEKVGTKIDISLNAEPLIGLEITIDLLCTAVGLVAGAVSGGTAAPGAVRLYGIIKGKMNSGADFGNDDFGAKFSADVFIDLVITSEIKTNIGFSFNTVSDGTDTKGKLEANNTLKVELKAGVWAKAEANLVIVKVEGYFEMSGKGYASITFGHEVNCDSTGLNYRPKLGFDGLNVEYVIKGKVGMSMKKKIPRGKNKKPAELKGSSEDEGIIATGKYSEVIPKFDVIKSLEEVFGISADIPLIRN